MGYSIPQADTSKADLTFVNELVSAVKAAAARCRQTDDSAADVINQLELGAIFESSALAVVRTVLFNTAEKFGNIDIDRSWQALTSAADLLLPTASPLKGAQLALRCRAGNWTSLQPIKTTLPLFVSARNHCWPVEHEDYITAELLGFPDGQMTNLKLMQSAQLYLKTKVSDSDLQCYWQSQTLIVLGLISGACQRIVDEAYEYARQRKSGGCVIAQHQAVALRLGELAVEQRGLSLFVNALVSEMGEDTDPDFRFSGATAKHVADSAFVIARDALQTAAGHGYVSGLIFKPSFEKLRTLSTMLIMLSEQYQGGAQ